MAVVQFVHKGDFTHLEKLLSVGKKFKPAVKLILHKYGKKGVEALRDATPKDTGTTADCWSYEIVEDTDGSMKIVWSNSNIQNGQLIAILLQYGHATVNGGYVEGVDYINPAIQSIFNNMAKEAWKEVRGK